MPSPVESPQETHRPPEFRFVGLWVNRVAFQSEEPLGMVPGEIPPGKVPYRLGFTVGAGISDDGQRAQITLTVTVEPNQQMRPYKVEVAVTGRFETVPGTATPKDFDTFCRSNVPAILFPYVRELVHRVTSDGPYGAVRLDPVNLVNLVPEWQTVEPTGVGGSTRPSLQWPTSQE